MSIIYILQRQYIIFRRENISSISEFLLAYKKVHVYNFTGVYDVQIVAKWKKYCIRIKKGMYIHKLLQLVGKRVKCFSKKLLELQFNSHNIYVCIKLRANWRKSVNLICIWKTNTSCTQITLYSSTVGSTLTVFWV